MKDVVQRIESWVRWHLWIGFEKLFLFFDDPHEADSMALALTVGGTAVEIIKRDEDLLTHWARQPSWVGHQATHAREVQVRQMLNVQYAMELCRRQGIAWLLNIDSDELFLPEPSSQSPVADVPSGDGTDGGVNVGVGAGSADALRGAVPALFASLAAAGVEVFAFANHEIIPEVVAPVDHKRFSHKSLGHKALDHKPIGHKPFSHKSLGHKASAISPLATSPSAIQPPGPKHLSHKPLSH